MTECASLDQRAAALRAEFDRTFADRSTDSRAERVSWVALRIGSVPYCIASSDTDCLVRLERVVPIPSRAHALRGVIGLRGAIVPVFDLSEVLGGDAARDPLRWAVLEGGESPIAFAFPTLEGVFQIDSSGASVDGAREICHDGRTVRAVIRLAAIARATRSVSS